MEGLQLGLYLSHQEANCVVNYAEGRYELYGDGDGTTRAPYYWVWIPAGGVTVPPPPPAIPVR